MNAEFNWWLLIVGLVVGAGLVWYVLMDARRREIDVDSRERPREAAWLAAALADEGWDVPPEAAERLLTLHRAYLEAPPPDADPDEAIADTGDSGDTRLESEDAGLAAGSSVDSELPGDDRLGLDP